MKDFQDLLRSVVCEEVITEGRKKGWSDTQKTTLKTMMSHSDEILKQGISEAFEVFFHHLMSDEQVKPAIDRKMKSKSAELRLKEKLMNLEKKFMTLIDQAYAEFHKGCGGDHSDHVPPEPKEETPKEETPKEEAPQISHDSEPETPKDEEPKQITHEEPHVPKTPDEMEHWVKERALHLHDKRKKKNDPEDHGKDFEDAKTHVMSYVQHTKEKPHEKFNWDKDDEDKKESINPVLYAMCFNEAKQDLIRLLRRSR